MTVTVDININIDENTLSERVVVEDSALADVRFDFNPSALKEVVVLKALAAAFITAANEVGRNSKDPGRESGAFSYPSARCVYVGCSRSNEEVVRCPPRMRSSESLCQLNVLVRSYVVETPLYQTRNWARCSYGDGRRMRRSDCYASKEREASEADASSQTQS